MIESEKQYFSIRQYGYIYSLRTYLMRAVALENCTPSYQLPIKYGQEQKQISSLFNMYGGNYTFTIASNLTSRPIS